MTSKGLQLLLNVLILGTFGSLLAFSEGTASSTNPSPEIKVPPPAAPTVDTPAEWLPMCIIIASKEKDQTAGATAPLTASASEKPNAPPGPDGKTPPSPTPTSAGSGSSSKSTEHAAQINSAMKEMAAVYHKCGIALRFHVYRIDPGDLTTANLDPERLQSLAKSACNFQRTYGVRGATQLFITDEFKPPPQPDGNGNGGTIDYPDFPKAMCRNLAASGCSTLCEPASFSAVLLGGGAGAEAAKTSIHESLHSNCCGRACLNIDDGRVQKLGGAMDNFYEIGVGPEPRRQAFLNFSRWHADTGINPNRAQMEAPFLEEIQKKGGSLPALHSEVCRSLQRGASKNPGAVTYDPNKVYLGENAIALANARTIAGNQNFLPSTKVSEGFAGSRAEIRKYAEEQRKNSKAKEAEYKEYYDMMEIGRQNTLLRNEDKVRRELRRENSKKAGADEAMGKAADAAEVQEGSNTPSSNYVFMGDKNGDGGLAKSQNSPPAQAISIPAIVPQTQGIASTNPGGGPQTGVGLMPSGNKGTGLYFKENLKGVRGLAGSNDGVNSPNTQRGATTGANGAKIVPKNRNGDSIETVTEDLLRAKPSITNRTPNNNRQIPGDYE